MKTNKTIPVYGLVLAGGKSTRMGMDKSIIAYHGIPQWKYLYDLLRQVCNKTFVSIRADQSSEFPKDMPCITDKNEYKGPYNGLLSAHSKYPNTAFLVLACDLPLMNLNAVKQLLAARDPDKYATAFATRKIGLPEPLAAIWEPVGLEKSIDHLKSGTSSCPRKFLINSNIALVHPSDEQVLLNANSQEDYKEVLHKLTSI